MQTYIFECVVLCAIHYPQMLARGGWGVTEYLQLDWMDDGMDGWMEKASRPQRPLLYVMFGSNLVRAQV